MEFLSIEDFFDKCEDVMNTSDTMEESDLNLAVIVEGKTRANTEKKPKKTKDLKIDKIREVKTLQKIKSLFTTSTAPVSSFNEASSLDEKLRISIG